MCSVSLICIFLYILASSSFFLETILLSPHGRIQLPSVLKFSNYIKRWKQSVFFLNLSVSLCTHPFLACLCLLLKSLRYWTSNGLDWIRGLFIAWRTVVAKMWMQRTTFADSCQMARLDDQTNSISITIMTSGAMLYLLNHKQYICLKDLRPTWEPDYI